MNVPFNVSAVMSAPWLICEPFRRSNFYKSILSGAVTGEQAVWRFQDGS